MVDVYEVAHLGGKHLYLLLDTARTSNWLKAIVGSRLCLLSLTPLVYTQVKDHFSPTVLNLGEAIYDKGTNYRGSAMRC